MSDDSTGRGSAGTVEPSGGLATPDTDPRDTDPRDTDPRDDARWLGAFLLAHRGKTFRLDVEPRADVGPASAAHAVIPTDVIDGVVRADR